MIIRTRRKNESLVRRLLRPWAHVPPPGYPNVLTPTQFEQEIAKERFRANRRSGGQREFAIVSIDFSDHKVKDQELEKLILDFCQRIRISDAIGWYQLRLAVLLPETNKDGAYLVANGLVDIAKESGLEIQTEVSVYPWDDKLVSRSNEHLGQFDSNESSDSDQPSDDMPSGDDHSHQATRSFEQQSFTRIDSNHSSGGHAVALEPAPVPKVSARNVTVTSPDFKSTNTINASSGASIDVEIAKRGTGTEISFLPNSQTPVWKRAIDITGAGVGLVALSPILLAAAAAIKFGSRGPVFFRQAREGKDGKSFAILKFRTMIVDAEEQKDSLRELSEQDGPAFKLKNDPRITGIGKYLRKSCIDELPQLWNVLVGQMSLVGPRPLPVGESEQCLAWQRQRLSVLPGLTCIWQARGSRDTKFSEWMRMDMEYIRRRGFWFDIKLLCETAMIVVLHRGSV